MWYFLTICFNCMAINIQTREEINARSMLAPETTHIGGLKLRPISLGSMELLRQLNNPLAAGESDLDTHTLAEFIWVHAAPLEEVVETVYNHPAQIAKKVTLFCMDISPAEIKLITASLAGERAAVEAASARPLEKDEESPNELSHP